jgi:hypothetical protein
MLTKNRKKIAKKFSCETCDYTCSNKYDFNKHLTTRKHRMLTNANFDANAKIATPSIVYKCDCGTTYNHKSSLSRHEKSCNKSNNSSKEPDKLVNTILELVKENQQFKNMLIEQHNHILKISEKPTIANCNNNSNNKNFNLNFFLNEQCKNAINLSEFIENVKLQLSDLENVADMGYVNGVTQIFMNGLKDMDIYTRPLHCTDIKREILHIRENDAWIKDTPDQEKIKSAIHRIAFRNIQQISEWNKLHPDSTVLDSSEYNRALQIMKESLGYTCPGGVDKNNERIAKNLIKSVYIDKNEMTMHDIVTTK